MLKQLVNDQFLISLALIANNLRGWWACSNFISTSIVFNIKLLIPRGIDYTKILLLQRSRQLLHRIQLHLSHIAHILLHNQFEINPFRFLILNLCLDPLMKSWRKLAQIRELIGFKLLTADYCRHLRAKCFCRLLVKLTSISYASIATLRLFIAYFDLRALSRGSITWLMSIIKCDLVLQIAYDEDLTLWRSMSKALEIRTWFIQMHRRLLNCLLVITRSPKRQLLQ